MPDIFWFNGSGDLGSGPYQSPNVQRLEEAPSGDGWGRFVFEGSFEQANQVARYEGGPSAALAWAFKNAKRLR